MAVPYDSLPAGGSNLFPVMQDSGPGVLPSGGAIESADGNQYTIFGPPNPSISITAGGVDQPYYEAATVSGGGGQEIAMLATSGIAFYVGGSLLAALSGTKTFVINHPLNRARYLVHACLEGPEVGVFYRGTAILDEQGKAQVELPAYFDALVESGSETVQLTPQIDDLDSPIWSAAATAVSKGRFGICGQPGGRVCWLVNATRRTARAFEPEPLRTLVQVAGDGPYTYLR